MAIRFYRHVVETAAPVAAQVVDIAVEQADKNETEQSVSASASIQFCTVAPS